MVAPLLPAKPVLRVVSAWTIPISAVAYFADGDHVRSAEKREDIAERKLPFDRVAELDWETALIVEDTRRDYGETRLRVIGRFDGVLHAVVVTPRGEDLRVISFRRAGRREVRRYEVRRNEEKDDG